MRLEDLEKINSYLVFKLGDEEFAANAGKVLHILELIKITEIPKCPTYMKGVVNLRGTVLPVIDTRVKFGLNATEFTSSTCIVVLETGNNDDKVEVGALVDSVQAVVEFDKNNIKVPPSITKDKTGDFITGMVEHEQKFMMVIDVDKVFSTEEILNLKTVSNDAKKTTIEEVKV